MSVSRLGRYQSGFSRPKGRPRLPARLMPCGLVDMITLLGASHVSLPSGPVRWRPAVLVPPAQEAGWADQNPARDRRNDSHGSITPIPFADHLEQSNRIARESDSVEVRFGLAMTGRPLGRDDTHPPAAVGDDRSGLAPACKPCPSPALTPAKAQPPITAMIGLARQHGGPGYAGAQAMAAYQPRPILQVGRLVDVIV